MTNFYFILLAIFEPWIEYCLHDFWRFLLNKFLQKMRLVFTVNCIRCSSGFGVRRVWLQRDVRKGTLNASSSVKWRQFATMSDSSNDSGVFCSVSSVDSEESEV